MRLLAVESASPTPSVAVSDGGRVRRRRLPFRRLDETLWREASGLLSALGLEPGDLDGVAAASGPGSFTGIRVGMAFVSALSQSLCKPAVAVSLFEAAAWRAAPGEGVLVVTLPAPRNEIFHQAFAPGPEPRPLSAPGWCPASDWPKTLARLAGGEAVRLAGPAVTAADLLAPAEAALRRGPAAFAPLYIKPAYFERGGVRPA